MSSSNVEEMIERGNPLFAADSGMRPQANQNPKTNKEETKIERRNPLFADSGRAPLSSEIPEWLQEFKENLVYERVPEHRDSHASSSHEVSFGPTSKRSEDLGKHSVYTQFPYRPKLRDLSKDQNYKSPVQKTQWRSRTSCRKFW